MSDETGINGAAGQSERTGVPPPPFRPGGRPLVLWFVGNARWVWPLLVLAVLVAGSWSDIKSIQYRQVREALHALDLRWAFAAALLTVVNLAVMGFYDVICFRSSKVGALSRWWIGTLAFSWSNFLTLGPLAGPAIRLWLYKPAGVTLGVLREAIASIAAGFSTGLLLWIAVGFIPLPGGGLARFAASLGLVFAGAVLAGKVAGKLQKWKRLPRWVHDLRVPWPTLFALGALDWLLAFLVFTIVMRASGISIPVHELERLFFLGQGLGLLSLIPGGLGSADAFWLARMGESIGRAFAGLISYRLVYYFIPWTIATLLLLRRAVHGKVRWAPAARALVSVVVVVSAVVILVSAATPGATERIRLLKRILPLGILDSSHAATGIIGLLLLVLARGLMKGYRDAYRATLFLLIAGAAGSLLKGLDYEESVVLAATALLLWTHSKLFSLPSRPGGTVVAFLVPVAIAIFVFAAVGLTAYNERMLHPVHAGFAARFLRTLSIMLLLGVLIAIHRIIRTPGTSNSPSDDEIEKALDMQRSIGLSTTALMAANGDKRIQFWQNSGFCLYQTTGSFMIVFSDPTSPRGTERRFVDAMIQRAAELDRTLVFYQVSAHWIPVLHDYGYSFFKLGEEAIVDLETFSIQGNKGKFMRNVLNRFRNEGYEFEVLQPDVVQTHISELRIISDEWLRSKNMREKRFSIGYFDEKYLARFPCAIVRDRTGKIVAFANVLLWPGSRELSVDLMRYLPECPNGVMDLLFLKLFEWGKAQGHGSFNLGMAPLATVGEVRQARLPERLARVLFQYGEHWYNFRGLRLFKEKYNPGWIPRYLAYPTFWMWPRVIAHVAMVIAGGWKNVVFPSGSETPPADAAARVGEGISSFGR